MGELYVMQSSVHRNRGWKLKLLFWEKQAAGSTSWCFGNFYRFDDSIWNVELIF